MKVIFSKGNLILSIVKIPDGRIVSKQQCAKNNGLKEEDIEVNYIEDNDLEETEEQLDTLDKVTANLKAGKGLKTAKEKQAEIENDKPNS